MTDRLDALKGPGQLTERETKYPVSKLWGDFLSIEPRDQKGNDGSEYTQVVLQVTDIEILAQEGEYPMPNYEIAVSYNEKANSKYGRFVQSAAEAVGADTSGGIGLKALFKDYLEGRRCMFEYADLKMGGYDENNKWDNDKMAKVWLIREVQGVGTSGETVDEAIARLKEQCSSPQDFVQKAMATPVLFPEAERIQAEAKTI